MTIRPALLAVAGLLLGCATAPAPAELVAQLKAADRAFDAAVSTDGVEAWVSFFADSGFQVGQGGPFTVGHGAIRAAMTGFFSDPTLKLRWIPDTAFASADGTLGYTVGSWRRLRLESGQETVLARGRYLTTWRRQADGAWKVEADIGNEAAPTP
jgi:ketosteroid isomerase-like protein